MEERSFFDFASRIRDMLDVGFTCDEDAPLLSEIPSSVAHFEGKLYVLIG